MLLVIITSHVMLLVIHKWETSFLVTDFAAKSILISVAQFKYFRQNIKQGKYEDSVLHSCILMISNLKLFELWLFFMKLWLIST